MKTEAQRIINKLHNDETLDSKDRIFILAFMMFAIEFQDFIKGVE